MFVAVSSQPGGDFTLRIWRINQPPSDVEWRTTIAKLPAMYQPAIVPAAHATTEGRRTIWAATWPAPLRLL